METSHPPQFSIEFFPPRTEAGKSKLDVVHRELAKLKPDFFSVTYGAGGSTKDGTREIVLRYQALGSGVAPHLSFGGTDEDEILKLLDTYKAVGISRLVALRGDIPSGMGAATLRDACSLRHHAALRGASIPSGKDGLERLTRIRPLAIHPAPRGPARFHRWLP